VVVDRVANADSAAGAAGAARSAELATVPANPRGKDVSGNSSAATPFASDEIASAHVAQAERLVQAQVRLEGSACAVPQIGPMGNRRVTALTSRTTSVAPPRGPTYSPKNFLLGTNLPWQNYGDDFGGLPSAPHKGVSEPEQSAKLDKTLHDLSAQGVTTIRWFLLADGRAITYDKHGTPTGIDLRVYTDIDAALGIAHKNGIKVIFSILDFHYLRAHPIAGKLPKHTPSAVLRSPAKMQALIDNVYTPILQRYAHNSNIAAWEVMNEPEWMTLGELGTNPWSAVSKRHMRAFLRAAVGAIHRYSNQQATVGSASVLTLGLVKGLGLDFYQPHWYDHFQFLGPLETPVAELHLDRPVVLGEFPTRRSFKSTKTVLNIAQRAGYGGAMPWSVNATDSYSAYAKAAPAMTEWAKNHQADLYRPKP